MDYSLGFKSSFGINLELGGALSTLEAPLYNKEYALGVFLEGVFNNASTDSLLNVLRSKRVSNTIIRWINSMLSSRIAGANSGEMNLEVHLLRGFPQGGVLSALMWILVADGLLYSLNPVRYFAQGLLMIFLP